MLAAYLSLSLSPEQTVSFPNNTRERLSHFFVPHMELTTPSMCSMFGKHHIPYLLELPHLQPLDRQETKHQLEVDTILAIRQPLGNQLQAHTHTDLACATTSNVSMLHHIVVI